MKIWSEPKIREMAKHFYLTLFVNNQLGKALGYKPYILVDPKGKVRGQFDSLAQVQCHLMPAPWCDLAEFFTAAELDAFLTFLRAKSVGVRLIPSTPDVSLLVEAAA